MTMPDPAPSRIPGFLDSEVTNRRLPRILRLQAERLGSRKYLDICGRSVTFEQMLDLTSRMALGLRRLGVNRGDRVAMLLPNCMELVVTWFAASSLGAIEVPNNPDLKGDLLCHNLNNCEAEILVADMRVLAQVVRVEDKLSNVRTLVLVGGDAADARAAGIKIANVVPFDECLSVSGAFEPVSVHHSDPMAILYTSGTTGPAKGALMSHHHCYSWASSMALNLGFGPEDSYFCALPLFHTDAQMFGVYLPLIYGTQGKLVDGFSASKFWDQARASGATATNLLGAMAVILMRAQARRNDADNPIRVCQCIPMVPDKEAFEQRFGMRLVTGYGQTETSFVTLDSVAASRPGSCGRAHPDWDVSIVDEADTPVLPGTIGEIVSRPKKSWSIFSGYYRSDAKTVQTLRNLWYHSGDAGYMDQDGWFYFKHRLNEAIRRRGENISAYEVESVAEKHPDVVESAAFGVPSEFTEEDIMIVTFRRHGSALEAEELLEHFRANAPRHVVPRYIEITDAPLPRTPTEKIARNILKQSGVTAATFDRERH
jgi:crotonobetaine/carnitine-CoA ligase